LGVSNLGSANDDTGVLFCQERPPWLFASVNRPPMVFAITGVLLLTIAERWRFEIQLYTFSDALRTRLSLVPKLHSGMIHDTQQKYQRR
jgi:hypothetical protein